MIPDICQKVLPSIHYQAVQKKLPSKALDVINQTVHSSRKALTHEEFKFEKIQVYRSVGGERDSDVVKYYRKHKSSLNCLKEDHETLLVRRFMHYEEGRDGNFQYVDYLLKQDKVELAVGLVDLLAGHKGVRACSWRGTKKMQEIIDSVD